MRCDLGPDGRIQCEIGYLDIEVIKNVPGAKWGGQDDKGHWYLPRSWTACKALRAEFGEKLEIGTALQTWAFEQLGWMRPALALRSATSLTSELELLIDPLVMKVIHACR